MSYAVKAVFATLQGEGYWAGTPSVFIRFGGCNLWSGADEHRHRDAERNDARCPMFCDTDFVGGERLSASEFTQRVNVAVSNAGMPAVPHIVLTGGEPLLQVDSDLIAALRVAHPEARLAVETNGTVRPRVPWVGHSGVRAAASLDWITLSPKVPADRILLMYGNELKVVTPSYSPDDYASIAGGFEHWYVSPEARILNGVGRSVIDRTRMRQAADWVRKHPTWKLSLQMHKILGVP